MTPLMTRSIFSRLYVQFTISLMSIVLTVAATLYIYGRASLEQYVFEHVDPLAKIVTDKWQGLNGEERTRWLALVSNLTGTQWHLFEHSQTDPVKISQLSLQDVRAQVVLKLDQQTAATITISDWSEWEKAYGWLLLDAISAVPSALREAKFQSLSAQAPWPMARVNRLEEGISPLGLRQLTNGQSLRVSFGRDNKEVLYFPAGANQVIRIGPLSEFELLTNIQWLILSAVSLLLLSLSFVFWVRPIQVRFETLINGVEAISEHQNSVDLPTQYQDDLGRLARRIDNMARRLILQLQQNKQLNQAVSHDLKTPLARIKFSLALLPTDPNNEYVQQITNDVELLNLLTQELLLYHQLNESSSSQATECDAMAVIKSVVAKVPDHLSVNLQTNQQDITVPIAEPHLRRVCDNLCNNAVQYGRGQIAITIEKSQQSLRLIVEDNGHGISEDQFEQLKQPFERLSKHRDSQNNNHGLGLALVEATVNHYQGQWALEKSTLGGARFVIDLPCGVRATNS